MEKILVAGANGTTGKKIITILDNSTDYTPIAMVRKEEQKKYFIDLKIDVVLADLEGDLQPAFEQSIDKVIFAAGSAGKKVIEVDQEGAKKLIDASINAKVKKFVMLSSMGADAPEKASELKAYLEAKHNADEYLKRSGQFYSIVRPGTLTNDAKLETIELELKLNKRGEISRSDVAQTLVESLHDKVAKDTTFEIINGVTSIKEALEKVSS